MPRHDEGFFSAKDNLRLFWVSDFPDSEPRAHVIIAHGYQDHVGRYRSITDALVNAGYAVHGLDFRGHGQSDGRRSHCDRFSDYVEDLDAFIERTKKQAGGKKLFLLAHSQGALISIHWLKRNGQGPLAGAILSAPYLKLAIDPPKLELYVSKIVGKVIPWLPVKSPLTSESLSHDVEWQNFTTNDPLYGRKVTPRWFSESLNAQKEALGFGSSFTLPVFLILGSEDQVAAPSAGREFFASIGSSDKTFKEYPGMRHEPMNEVGKEQVHADLVGWISSHL